MPGIALVGIDSAGGLQQGGGQTKFKYKGALVAVLGDTVASHGSGPHQGAKMVQGSTKFRVQGIPVCLAGHAASCGDQTTGQPTFNVSS